MAVRPEFKANLDQYAEDLKKTTTSAAHMAERSTNPSLKTKYVPALKKVSAAASGAPVQDTGVAATRIAEANPNPVRIKQTPIGAGANNKLFKPEQEQPSSPDTSKDSSTPRPGAG